MNYEVNKKALSQVAEFLGFILACMTIGALFFWYSYVWGIGEQISYWQWVVITTVILYQVWPELKKVFRWPMLLIFVATCMAQVLIFLGIIQNSIL
jgi:hypothetical protein